MNFRIRPMTPADLHLAVEWAAAEGWNPGLHDASTYREADPTGFFLGTLDDEPIASLSAVRYGADFGFIGFYIVKPAHRERGYGLQIWNAGLRHLAGRTIGLDGVLDQQTNYARSGFQLAHRNIRFQGSDLGDAPNSSRVIDLACLPFETVLTYDRPLFPADRTRFLSAWLRQPEAKAVGLIDGDRLLGYGVRRPCRMGFKIGPLFADTPAIAADLFAALRSGVADTADLFIDVPEANATALALVRHHGFAPVFETARMFTAPAPVSDLALPRIYGVTSFEIG